MLASASYDAKRGCGIGVVDPGAVPGRSTTFRCGERSELYEKSVRRSPKGEDGLVLKGSSPATLLTELRRALFRPRPNLLCKFGSERRRAWNRIDTRNKGVLRRSESA